MDARTEAIVDVHHDDTGGARVQHGEQGGQPVERGSVPHRRRHGNEGDSGQAADDGWQGSLHSRDHDETVGPVEVVAHIQQAVQTRDADVDDRRHVRAEGASGVGSLDGDRPVRCSGGNHDHVSPRCRPFPDGRASSVLVYVSVPAEGLAHGSPGISVDPGGEREPVGMSFPQRTQQGDGLLRRLAGTEDHLWISRPHQAVGVQSRKPQVTPAHVATHRPDGSRAVSAPARRLGAHKLTRVPIQPRTRLGYLGPEATFTEAAARTVPSAGELLAYPTVPAALDAVRQGEVDGAVVPVESSVEGSVNATLDELIRGEPLAISAEVLLPVSMALMARPGTVLGSIRQIVTHPVAEAQCRRWVAAKMPGARIIVTTSTAAAAAAEEMGPGGRYDAAIAAPVAAERYGLETLATAIGDYPDAVTRFVLVTKPAPPPPPTGADRTSLVAFIRDDHPGALLEILEQFAARGVNLTRIESRPTGNGMGRYCFAVDCEGHVADARVGEALMGLRRVCADVRFLGSYPRADGIAASPTRGTANEDFANAQAWLARLRS
jgi:prephenate dehydratase